MPLSAGVRLGPYEVLATLGAGGMGEVYRARDTKLGREVAIKVLPAAFANDGERMARFQREAQVLASLNHPNIAAIYGLEESGGLRALVMELVEGPTLADRISAGAIPWDDALPIARQIAEALAYAHEKGIVHRDLKPANVKVTAQGKVKVLDFGLAKVFTEEQPSPSLSQSPTLTAAATRDGVILGTAAYMSPEQARGKAVDKRTDIWAFGCLLFEMLSGRKVFGGDTVSDAVAKLLEREPDWQALPDSVPAIARSVLRKCLQKDAGRRLHDISDARIELEEPAAAAAIAAIPPRAAQSWIPWGLALILMIVAMWALLRTPRGQQPAPVARLVVPLPPKEVLDVHNQPAIALSPDGTRLVFRAGHGGRGQLFLHQMDHFAATPIPDTEQAVSPFFSPDGEWLGFFADKKLKKIALSGGAPVILCDAASPRGADWGDDGTIVFCPNPSSGLMRIRADGSDGGKVQVLTTPDNSKGEYGHRWPNILPGGQAALFTFWNGSTFGGSPIGVVDLKTGKYRTLIQGGTYARYAASQPGSTAAGHVVYARPGELMAVPFNLDRLEVAGPPVAVVEGLMVHVTSGGAEFALSRAGSLVYAPGEARASDRTLNWVDRKGASQALPAPPRSYMGPRLSPDGRRVAVGVEGSGLWMYDVARGALSMMVATAVNTLPLWTPDGRNVTFRGQGALRLFQMPADGSGSATQIAKGDGLQWPGSWSPDGKVLAFVELDQANGSDIWILSVEGGYTQRPFLQTAASEGAPAFSPNGQWLAYVSDQSGRDEVYVQPYPGPGGRIQISTEGGTEPVWARGGRELFYRAGSKMMAVAVQTKPEFTAGKPQVLFEANYERSAQAYFINYDVAPDGRFLMVKGNEEVAPSQLNVVLNFFDELRRRVPPGK